MPLTAAEQAVVDHLAAEPGPATVRFRKSRAFPGCQLHQAEFATRGGQPQHILVRTWQEPDGSWVADPIGGGAGAGPHRTRPWVNFAAGWNTDLFAAGGQVIGDGAQAARLVRLTFADGTALADTVDNGVVLFCASPGVALPATVQILGGAVDVLAEYDEFSDLQ
jgi:hypothetical protein